MIVKKCFVHITKKLLYGKSILIDIVIKVNQKTEK